MGKISGGCCGMVVGCALVVAAVVALVATGIYWWLYPDARERSFEVSTRTWKSIRTEIDSRMVRNPERNSPPPEPEVPEFPVGKERESAGKEVSDR